MSLLIIGRYINYFITVLISSIVFGIPYLDFNVSINNNPYPEDIFIHSTTPGNEHMFMAISSGADAVAAASMFHYTEQTPREAKDYLNLNGIPTRK